MRIFDQKFHDNKIKYFCQTLFGGLAVGTALLLFDIVNRPVIIASLGASAFIAFTMPRQRISGPRYLLGGYSIGIIVGVIMHCVTLFEIEHDLTEKLMFLRQALRRLLQ